MKPILQAALEYVERGWSIIPTHPNKVAAVKWEYWQENIPTKDQVWRWFAKEYRCIAVICGSVSNLIVVDIERHGVGLYQHLAGTLAALSQRNGVHWYYTYRPEKLRHTLTADGVHVGDVRGDGQYVLVPPSIGEDGQYRWLNGDGLARLPDEFLYREPPREMTNPPLFSHSLAASACPTSDKYPSRSERIYYIASHVVRHGGSFEDFKQIVLGDWSGSKAIEKGDGAEKYLMHVFDRADSQPMSGRTIVGRLVGVAKLKTTDKGERLRLQFKVDDFFIYQGVTLIEGSERTIALQESLPGLIIGSECRMLIDRVIWNGVSRWQVKQFLGKV